MRHENTVAAIGAYPSVTRFVKRAGDLRDLTIFLLFFFTITEDAHSQRVIRCAMMSGR